MSWRIFLVGVAFWAVPMGLAGARFPAVQDRPSFAVESQLVLLHVTVKEGKNRYVSGLPEEAFTVFDNDRRQKTRFFLEEDAPATVGLLVDSSGSMLGNRALVTAAATAFVETSNPKDEIFALAFNEDVRSALPAAEPFTSDALVLGNALSRTLGAYGRTALYDAVARGLDYANEGSHLRKVLIVVSDGNDNASHARLASLMAKLEASNVVVYGVALVDPIEEQKHVQELKRMAQATGGEAFVPEDIRHVNDVLQRIARDIRQAYVLAYEPDAETTVQGIRHLRVVVNDSSHRRLLVRTRNGYLTTGPQRRNDDER